MKVGPPPLPPSPLIMLDYYLINDMVPVIPPPPIGLFSTLESPEDAWSAAVPRVHCVCRCGCHSPPGPRSSCGAAGGIQIHGDSSIRQSSWKKSSWNCVYVFWWFVCYDLPSPPMVRVSSTTVRCRRLRRGQISSVKVRRIVRRGQYGWN